jgi:hypothetical protein
VDRALRVWAWLGEALLERTEVGRALLRRVAVLGMPKPGASSSSDDSESSSSSPSTSTGALSGRCGGVRTPEVDPVTGSEEPAGVLREAEAVLWERGGFAGGSHGVSMQLNF